MARERRGGGRSLPAGAHGVGPRILSWADRLGADELFVFGGAVALVLAP